MPPTIYRLDTETEKRDVFAQPKVPFDSSQYELKQVFYTSKDSAKVPMFIAGKKGLKQDGTERLLMTGYGGFDLGMTPKWNPAWAWWMQEGGWFALPNMRGGDEYGEHWHEQAMFEKKQNVFDDWFAAAEYLIANKYTRPSISRFADGRTADCSWAQQSRSGPICSPRCGAVIRCWTCCATRSFSRGSLGNGVWLRRPREAVPVFAEVLAVSERENRHKVPRGDVLDGIERYARGPLARAQDDGAAAG